MVNANVLFIAHLRSIVRRGSVRIIDSAGRSHEVGDGTSPAATVRLKTRRFELALALNPALALGEGYTKGLLLIEEGTLYGFVEVLARNYGKLGRNAWLSLLE